MAIGLAFTAAQADVILADKFENYSLQGIGMAKNGWAITNVQIRSGNYAAMHTLPAVTTKPQPNANLFTTAAAEFSIDAKGRARSETTLKGDGDLQRGKSYTIRFSNKVSDPYANASVFQIHKRRAQGDPTGQQPMKLHVRDGRWVLAIHSNSADGKQFDLGEIASGQYVDWVIKVKLSSGDDGSVEVTKNGKNVLNYHGPNDFRSDGDPYVKFGLYRPAASTGEGRQTAFYDNVSVSGD